MEKLNLKIISLVKAQQAFERSIDLFENQKPNASLAEQEAYTASIKFFS